MLRISKRRRNGAEWILLALSDSPRPLAFVGSASYGEKAVRRSAAMHRQGRSPTRNAEEVSERQYKKRHVIAGVPAF
jgi:hypothetical protein